MKDVFYFSHDYGARNDPKLVKLQMKLGHEGKGLYWDIIEMLYEQGGYLSLIDIETYAFELRTSYERITDIIQNYDLFKNDGKKFWSDSVLERLKKRQEKSDKARESINKRWKNTTVIRTNNEGNTIKERKGKENKDNIYTDFLDLFNQLTGKKFKGTVKDKKQFNARLSEGYSIEDFKKAIEACKKDKYHIENPQYLTPEFITRADKLQKYLNTVAATVETKPTTTYDSTKGRLLPNGFVERLDWEVR